jgi:hypothetical protein
MRTMSRMAAGIALAAFLIAMLAVVIVSATSGDEGGTTTTTTARTTTRTRTTTPTTTKAAPAPAKAVKLTGAGAYDPEGDRHENDNLASLAVDGNPSTFWKTEHYRNGFTKTGVGLLLDAGRRRHLTKVVVDTDSPGAAARIELGDDPAGPFNPVSVERPLNGRTAFPLTRGAAGRYVVVWVTAVPEPGGEAHVAEVRALSPGS